MRVPMEADMRATTSAPYGHNRCSDRVFRTHVRTPLTRDVVSGPVPVGKVGNDEPRATLL